jgi:nucleoside-diphosphate-sugar epimerase
MPPLVKVAVTGARGNVARVIVAGLDPGTIAVTPLDLPDHDAADLDQLVAATAGHDALVHCAWADLGATYAARRIDPVNTLMTFNAYEAAARNGVRRVVMASSNHAHRHDVRDTDGKVRASIPPVPDSPYGAEKVFMEALGRYYAAERGLEVVCIRIGNVNREDQPNDDVPSRWISHADLGRLVTCCLTSDVVPDGFQIVYGVSRQDTFDWSNPFGYEPVDGS